MKHLNIFFVLGCLMTTLHAIEDEQQVPDTTECSNKALQAAPPSSLQKLDSMEEIAMPASPILQEPFGEDPAAPKKAWETLPRTKSFWDNLSRAWQANRQNAFRVVRTHVMYIGDPNGG